MNARFLAVSCALLIVGVHSGCRIQKQTQEAQVKSGMTRPGNIADLGAATSAEFDLMPVADAPSQRSELSSTKPAYGNGTMGMGTLSAEPYSLVDEATFSTHSPQPALVHAIDPPQALPVSSPEPPSAMVLPAAFHPESTEVTPEKQAQLTIQPAAHAAAAPTPINASVVTTKPLSSSAAAGNAVLNTTSVAVNYRVGRVGPSGLGKVEAWGSSDQGHTWQRLKVDGTGAPLYVELPGDGHWGIRLAATNGNGFGGTAPKHGDQASFTALVDTTAPHVQLGNVDPNTDGQSLQLRWSANDSNFGREAITLYYRVHEGSWQLIANKLDNSGQYRWEYPRDKGSHFYFRVQATDKAGNSTCSDSQTAVALDMTVPNLIVVGVTGTSKQTSGN